YPFRRFLSMRIGKRIYMPEMKLFGENCKLKSTAIAPQDKGSEDSRLPLEVSSCSYRLIRLLFWGDWTGYCNCF
ncbi:MAG: hypothetical protein ACXU9P_11085, partial [Thermodesulfobacteriota bacterium]